MSSENQRKSVGLLWKPLETLPKSPTPPEKMEGGSNASNSNYILIVNVFGALGKRSRRLRGCWAGRQKEAAGKQIARIASGRHGLQWISISFQLVFLWCSMGFLLVFLWYSMGFHLVFHGCPLVCNGFPWILQRFSMEFLWCPMDFLWFPLDVLSFPVVFKGFPLVSLGVFWFCISFGFQ